jgi:hypothetical protein
MIAGVSNMIAIKSEVKESGAVVPSLELKKQE